MSGLRSKPLPGLARRLSERYPGIEIGACGLFEYDEWPPVQLVEYRGSREQLIAYGLAAPVLFEAPKDRRRPRPTLETGDRWYLHAIGSQWRLTIYTDTHPPGSEQCCGTKKLQREVGRMLKRAFSAPRRESRA